MTHNNDMNYTLIETNEGVQSFLNENQNIELILYDTDLDGNADEAEFDENDDGSMDVIAYDYNQDGEWDKFKNIS